MTPQHTADERDVFTRQYEYDDDETVIVADFGTADGDATVDVVDETAIVVVDGPEGTRQEEFDLPAADAEAFIRNGVLTIEVSA